MTLYNLYHFIDGGICYGIHPNGDICDNEKYFWVQAEAFSTAKLLERAFSENGNSTIDKNEVDEYQRIYQNIWEYCWDHMIDHKYGAWFRIRLVIYIVTNLMEKIKFKFKKV